ncbi:unnamed protein product [Ilex paraguariensis]|uniref:tRNA pseudouridine synthase n=1 Tax=Ilex paraguariensis TaxID=185542 RepID=A0ABC8UZ66_9AQUA
MIKYPRVTQIPRYLMERQTQNKVYAYYDHTDASKYSRWTTKECYQFMSARPWQQVLDYYSDLVRGQVSLSALFGIETHPIDDDADIVEASDESGLVSVPTKNKTGKWARVTFKIVLSYYGGSFGGWQRQPGLNTVQSLVERSLGEFVDENKAQLLKDKGLPVEGCAAVAGRTDKGVTAWQQVCSFYTWRQDVKARDIEYAINSAAPGKLRVISVAEVSRVFHPNFAAKWRRYLYIFPFCDGEEGERSSQNEEAFEDIDCVKTNDGQRNEFSGHIREEDVENLLENDKHKPELPKQLSKFRVSKVNQLLRQLEGKLLSYKMFARDTKASRNTGPPTECFVFHARATEATLPCAAKVSYDH